MESNLLKGGMQLDKKKIDKHKVKNDTIAKLRAIGQSCREISKAVHLSHSQVAKKLKDPEIKKIIESFQRYYISYGEKVQKGFMELVLSKDPKVRQKAIEEYHSVIGISPSHTSSIFIKNLYQDNRQQILSPDVVELLGKHLQDNIIDVTPLEIEKMRPKEDEEDEE